MSAPQPQPQSQSTSQLKSFIDEVIVKLNPQKMIAELGNMQSTMKILTDISSAMAGSLITVGQIKQKFDNPYQSSVYEKNPFMLESMTIQTKLPQKTGANINGHFYTLTTLRSVLSTILTITAVGLLAAGGFMAFANRDTIQDYVEDRIQPMVDNLNMKQVIGYLSIISKRVMNYVQHSTSPIVRQNKSKFLKHSTPAHKSPEKLVHSGRRGKPIRITSRSKSARKVRATSAVRSNRRAKSVKSKSARQRK